MGHARTAVTSAVVVLLATAGLAGCATAQVEQAQPEQGQPPPATSSPAPPAGAGPAGPAAGSPASSSAGSALAALARVPVKGRAPRTGYDREQFGAAWTDVDHNGCDTRNDVLARDLTDETTKPGTHGCVVLTGTLADPYAPRTIRFERGPDSAAVQIDHLVALSDAWQKGAQQWDEAKRTALANDPLNLLAVDGPLNEAKGDGDAATWLPPNRAFRCTYVARQTAVKLQYGLWMTRAEEDAVAGVLAACPDEPLPGPVAAGAPAPSPSSTVAAAPVPAPDRSAVTADYANCTEVRAAGAAPIHRGAPGWRDAFDRDGDGTGCDT